MIRTLLNMHTQFAGCMTCHNNPDKIDQESLSFAWLNYSGIKVTGKPFGIDIDPGTGYLQETDDFYSKIAAYRKTADGNVLLETLETDPKVQEYLAVKDQLSNADLDAVKKSYHKIVSEQGRQCSLCHTAEDKSYLPFRELDFSDKRIDDLTNLNIIGIIEKYKKFYLPNLYEDNVPAVKAKTNKKTEAPKPSDDPKDWWQKNFDSPSEGQ
jgi:hypothetical protein